MAYESRFLNILRAIKREKCVLVLGDEFEIEDGKTLKNILFEQLPYLQEGSFLHFSKRNDKTNACDIIEEELEKIDVPTIYQKLVQIPFHIVISLGFDSIVEQGFQEQGFDYIASYYDRTKGVAELPVPTKEKPLLYNLFGNIGEDESVVLSKDDVFDFLTSVLGSCKFPNVIIEQLQKATNVIFLGCRYNSWQTEFIMKLLDFQEGFALNKTEELAEARRNFYVDTLKVEFMELEPHEFLEKLYQEAENQNLLRDKLLVQDRLSQLSEKEKEDLHNYLEELIEKKSFYLSEKAIVADIEQKFSINKKIKQLEVEIQDTRKKLEG